LTATLSRDEKAKPARRHGANGAAMSGPTALLLFSGAVVVIGFVAGVAARLVLTRMVGPPNLGLAASTLCGVVGGVMGGAITALASGESVRDVPVRALLGDLAGTILVLAIAERIARRRRAAPPGAAELIAAGESSTVEFKSSARYNHRTGARDARLELVIATAVAGFFNARGGTLLIGVADDGTVLGLAEDYRLQRHADADRYQLWLRDLLSATLGAPAAAQVDISFAALGDQEICLLRVPAAARPVFVRIPKQATTKFVTRIGNSTRELSGEEMLHYALGHWPARRLGGPTHRRPRRIAAPRRIRPAQLAVDDGPALEPAAASAPQS
jgi:uncharacterized membrane protein YeaQ/YmgE (transglycosylase-associated protein family)